MGMNRKDRANHWSRLLSNQRLHGTVFPTNANSRSEFQRDYDRIVFSSAFRRLQDKTQVFPLSHTDYTRTRLTHTLEVSSVARTLGVLAAKHLVKLGVKCEPHEVGTIVATAALAHDLGNPPFGHSGEAAIQAWAKRCLLKPADGVSSAKTVARVPLAGVPYRPMRTAEVADFHSFEGNAQGFRILVRTAARTRKGGLRPTIATLGAMVKYPRPSLVLGYDFNYTKVSQKKPGYFQNDSAMAGKAFRAVGMMERAPGVFSRHPLAFLTEAADDVCYAIADIEDGFQVGAVTFQEIRDVLLPIALGDQGFREATHINHAARLSRMRSSALSVLSSNCIDAFRANLGELETFTLEASLIQRTGIWERYQAVKDLAKTKVYSHPRVLQIEYAGFQTIGGLLDMFYAALCNPGDSGKDHKLQKLLPSGFLYRPGRRKRTAADAKDSVEFSLMFMTPYERMLAVTDYISGMTDRFAIQLFQRLSGIRLPE
jgi:dGTPase